MIVVSTSRFVPIRIGITISRRYRRRLPVYNTSIKLYTYLYVVAGCRLPFTYIILLLFYYYYINILIWRRPRHVRVQCIPISLHLQLHKLYKNPANTHLYIIYNIYYIGTITTIYI